MIFFINPSSELRPLPPALGALILWFLLWLWLWIPRHWKWSLGMSSGRSWQWLGTELLWLGRLTLTRMKTVLDALWLYLRVKNYSVVAGCGCCYSCLNCCYCLWLWSLWLLEMIGAALWFGAGFCRCQVFELSCLNFGGILFHWFGSCGCDYYCCQMKSEVVVL